MKYSATITEDIVKYIEENGLIDYGGSTLTRFLEEMHIDDRTWYRWLDKAEFAEAVKKAKEVYKANLEKKLVDSLAKSAMGFEADFTRTEYTADANGKPIISKQIKEKRPIAPNVSANIFLLTNLNPQQWKQRNHQEITGEDGEPLAQSPVNITISETKKVEVEK